MLEVKRKFYEFSRILKWYLRDIEYKYSHIYAPLSNIIFKTILALVLFFLIYMYFDVLGILKISHTSKLFDSFIIFPIEYELRNLVNNIIMTQISITFLTTAILSLVSSLDSKYILGEKTINLLFKKNGSLFTILFYVIYLLMFVNIGLIISQIYISLIYIIFTIALLLLIYIINKIGKIFLGSNGNEYLLIQKYYIDNFKMIYPASPQNRYVSKELNLFSDRIENGIKLGSTDYAHNLRTYIYIINKTLFNYPKAVEESLIDYNFKDNMINNVFHFCNLLYKNGKKDDTFALLNNLLEMFNYHKVYISSYLVSQTFFDLIDEIESYDNYIDLKSFISKIFKLIPQYNRQVFLCDTNDFSYTRLAKIKFLNVSKDSLRIYERIYNNIHNSKIDRLQKEKIYINLFEEFRMSSFNSKSLYSTIDSYSPKRSFPDRVYFEPYIIGLPVAVLFIRMFSNNDFNNLSLFLQMNLDDKEIQYAKHVSLMYILNMKINENENNIYNEFRNMNFELVSNFISRNREKFLKYDKIENLYSYIRVHNLVNQNELSKLPFVDSYIVEFEDELINNYFYFISKIKGMKINIKIDKRTKNFKKIQVELDLLFKK